LGVTKEAQEIGFGVGYLAGQNLVHSLERGALFEVLEPMERRRRNAQFPGKLGVSRFPLFSPQEGRKLFVKSARHTGILPKVPFRMRNICVDRKRTSGLLS
jgi:hypothetical protein